MEELNEVPDGTYEAITPSGQKFWFTVGRVDPPQGVKTGKLCDGHNPAQLTEEQVGVMDGWRLLADEEIGEGKGKHLAQSWMPLASEWGQCVDDGPALHFRCTYRTQMPAGYFADLKVAFRRDVLVDLKKLDRAIAFGHPNEVVEQMILKYENL